MSAKSPIPQTLAYQGVRAVSPPNVIRSKGSFARDPNSNDRKYPLDTIWINAANNSVWQLTSITAAIPVWTILGSGLGNGLAPVTATTTAVQLINGRSYISSNAGLSTFTLPLTANVQDSIRIIGQGAGFWKLGQNAGQSVIINAATTTAGTGGSITATQVGNVMDITCTVANTTWTVTNISGVQAAYTVA